MDELCFGAFWPTGIEEVTYQDGVIELADTDIASYNSANEEIALDVTSPVLSVGDVIVFDNNGFVTARKVNSSSNNGTYKLDIPEIEEVVDSLLESDVTEISFQDIVNYYGEENLVVTDNNSKGQFVPVSKTFSKEARSKGFKIEAKENSQKLEISVTDNKTGATCQLPNGPEVSEDYENFDVSLDIDSILVGSQIKYKRLIDVEYASVAVDIHSKFEGGVATDAEVGDKILLFEVPTSLDCGAVSVKIQIYLA